METDGNVVHTVVMFMKILAKSLSGTPWVIIAEIPEEILKVFLTDIQKWFRFILEINGIIAIFFREILSDTDRGIQD